MITRPLFLLSLLASATLSISAAPVDFARQIRPILSDNCFACHGPDEHARKAKLRLDSLEGATAPHDDHAAVVPNNPNKSELIRRITATDPDDLMPPPKTGKHLTPAQTDLLRQWIAQGAPWPQHWSFVPPQRPAIPPVTDPTWPHNPIDAFILSRLDRDHLTPNPPADKPTLLRRLSLDLIGLPPTPAEVDAFLSDPSPNAYENQVDRLLSSPRFGEHWATYWLDLARYADSNGYQRDGFRTVWPWRDWVIKALNADMPYTQFAVEQIAGDLLPNPTLNQKIATGFNRNGTVNVEAGTIPEADRVKQVVDRVNTTGTAFLGLTIECAQCHDHKFDPISQKDYYRLFAYFNNTPIESKYRGNSTSSLDFTDGPSVVVAGSPADLQRRQQLVDRYAALQKDCDTVPDKKTRQELAKLEKQIDAVPITASLVMQDLPKPRQTHILKRGQFDDPTDPVTPGTPAILHPLDPKLPPNRLGLAQWLTDDKNPLLARVAVNRWWARIFGRGIVSTPEDFGTRGEPPTHPQLLDYLAVELRDNHYSMKHVLRLIVTSNTYQQSSRITPEKLSADPNNALLSRGPRFRMPAEMIRDNALAAAGLLSDEMFGPPVFPPQPAGLWRVIGKVDNTYRTSTGPDRYRRGLYTIWRRSAAYPAFLNFDANDRSACTVQRQRSNTPVQALTLMNDEAYVEAATALAKRTLADCPTANTNDQLTHAFRLCLARPPKPAELQLLCDLHQHELDRLKSNPSSPKPANTKTPEESAMFYVATTLLNLDETITKG